MRFFEGLIAPFRGVSYIFRRGLLGYLLLPVVLNLVIACGAAFGLSGWFEGWAEQAFPSLTADHSTLASVGVWLVFALASVLAFIIFQPLIAGPFIDILCERIERKEGATFPDIGLLRGVWRAILHGLLRTALYLGALLVAVVLGAVTGVGAMLGSALYALFLAYDGFDYPLARRDFGFRAKWRFLKMHPGLTLGYCVGASALFLIPVVNLLAPVGGSRRHVVVFGHHPETRENIANMKTAYIETEKGEITVELYDEAAPETVANFIGLATGEKAWTDPKSGEKSNKPFYDGLTFHRVIPDFVIQGAAPSETAPAVLDFTSSAKPPVTSRYTKSEPCRWPTLGKTPAALSFSSPTARSRIWTAVTPSSVRCPREWMSSTASRPATKSTTSE